MMSRHQMVRNGAHHGFVRSAALGILLLSMTSCGGDEGGGSAAGDGGAGASGGTSTSAGDGGATGGGPATTSTGSSSSTAGTGAAPPVAGFGEPCDTGDDCESGFCASDETFSEKLCSAACSPSVECPSADWCCFDPNDIGSGLCRPVAWGDC